MNERNRQVPVQGEAARESGWKLPQLPCSVDQGLLTTWKSSLLDLMPCLYGSCPRDIENYYAQVQFFPFTILSLLATSTFGFLFLFLLRQSTFLNFKLIWFFPSFYLALNFRLQLYIRDPYENRERCCGETNDAAPKQQRFRNGHTFSARI